MGIDGKFKKPMEAWSNRTLQHAILDPRGAYDQEILYVEVIRRKALDRPFDVPYHDVPVLRRIVQSIIDGTLPRNKEGFDIESLKGEADRVKREWLGTFDAQHISPLLDPYPNSPFHVVEERHVMMPKRSGWAKGGFGDFDDLGLQPADEARYNKGSGETMWSYGRRNKFGPRHSKE